MIPTLIIKASINLHLFYCLLISFSEHIGFIKAYAVSTLMTIVMITLYSIGILKMKKTSCYIGAALSALYVYIFVLIQMETYALLAGSLGLFAILGLMMYFSQRINWNNADKVNASVVERTGNASGNQDRAVCSVLGNGIGRVLEQLQGRGSVE